MRMYWFKKISCILMYAGAAFLIGHYSSWYVVLGIFIWQWADNYSASADKDKRINDIAEKFYENNSGGNKSKFMQKLDEAMERSNNGR